MTLSIHLLFLETELMQGVRNEQLDDAIKALTSDLRWASSTIQADLDRFQRQKVGDLREMCLDFSTFHKEWAEKVRASLLLPTTEWR